MIEQPTAARYADILIDALVGAAGDQPDRHAALGALVFVQAYLLSSLTEAERKEAIDQCDAERAKRVAEFVAERELEEATPAGHG